MNKMYLAIIGFLLVIALLVGGYAFYKTANQTAPVYTPPPQIPTAPPPAPATTATPAATPAPTATTPSIPLSVTSFKNGDIVSVPKLTIKGQTVANADVSINGTDIKADSAGLFTSSLTLEEGDNSIEIVASDADGNNTTWDGTVTYTPAQ